MNQKLELWQTFCNKYLSDGLGIPLFSTRDCNIVNLIEYGKQNPRLVLQRSDAMENFIINEVTKVINDFYQGNEVYEGLIYIMYYLNDGMVVPLYIGKSEKYGKQGNNLSVNIKDIDKKGNKDKFCRWGYGYAYHVGDLSAIVCPNHSVQKIQKKYQRWAQKLFESYPTAEPKLKRDVYFWVCAWQKGNVGIFPDFGGTPLTALEYQLISVAATLFPESLLNYEGVNRGQKFIWILLLDIYSKILLERLLTIRN